MNFVVYNENKLENKVYTSRANFIISINQSQFNFEIKKLAG